VITEYERGVRDGMTAAADILDKYPGPCNVPVSRDVRIHLHTAAEGLRLGVSLRELDGHGELK
jgi:hypothetical protein